MKVIRFFLRYWAAIGGLLFVVLAFMLGLIADTIPMLQRLMILLFMSLLFHQFEEYIFPGGFPAACNKALFGENKELNIYPLNEASAFTVNVICAYPLYIAAIFCYQYLWFDIFIAYFSMAQVLMHCLKMNISLRSWYCPGAFSALLVMLPLGVYTLWYISNNHIVPAYCWWAPIVAFPFVSLLTIMLPIQLFKRRDSKFAFAPYQEEEFAVRNGIASLFRNNKSGK